MSSAQQILAGYDGLQVAQEAFYKDLHQHPELSHQEQRTAQHGRARLAELQNSAHGVTECWNAAARASLRHVAFNLR